MADRPGGAGGVLPRGRHGLSREEVEASQRARIMLALAEAMAEKGYAATSVADVLKRARVSRETFYEHHDSKLDCFLQTFDAAAAVLQASIGRKVESPSAAGPTGRRGDRGALLERSIGAYLDVLLAQPAFARLFLVESYAAGAAAIERRATVQARFADALLGMVGRSSEEDRIAAQALVAFIGTSVTMPLARNDLAALAALRPALDHRRPGAPRSVGWPRPRGRGAAAGSSKGERVTCDEPSRRCWERCRSWRWRRRASRCPSRCRAAARPSSGATGPPSGSPSPPTPTSTRRARTPPASTSRRRASPSTAREP